MNNDIQSTEAQAIKVLISLEKVTSEPLEESRVAAIAQAEQDAATAKCEARRLLALRTIGLSQVGVVTMTNMLADRRPWPVMTLAEAVGFSRAAVRKTLVTLQGAGCAERDPDVGWVLTQEGLWLGGLIIREVDSIAAGRTRRFSPVLCAAVDAARLRPNCLSNRLDAPLPLMSEVIF